MGALEDVEAATARYKQTEAAHEESRGSLVTAVLAALRGGARPTDVAAKSPFTETYIRKLARENGIPEYLLRRYPKARAELETRLPEWRDLAREVADLDVGLDDEEFVGGAVWYGLTYRGAEGNPARQKSAIVDRLVRWATRDGGSGPQIASALHEVLDRHVR